MLRVIEIPGSLPVRAASTAIQQPPFGRLMSGGCRHMVDQALPPARLRTRRALIAGFGGLLVLMALAGTNTLRVLKQWRARDVQIRRNFLSRNSALEQIRSGIYLSGTYVRDYLLAPEPAGAEAQWAKLQGIERDTSVALDRYANSLDPAELQPFRDLGSEIHLYFRVLDLIFHPNSEEKRKHNNSYFYNDIVQRRTAMLEIADRIAVMNEQELSAGDAKIAATFDRFRLSLIATLAITLGGGLILAIITIAHLLRLDGDARGHYLAIVRAQAELKELSARLVQAQEEERRAISRELHDEVGQSLSALLMESGNLAAIAPPGSAELQRHLDSIKRLAESSVTVIRNMTLLLRPSMLDDFGLVPALRWQAREISKRTGLRIHVDADEAADDLPDEHKTCIYRVVQETLNNCARHAQARTVEIAVRREPDRILLTVQDDGNGFDPRHVRGLGLLGMEERVAHLDGIFEVRSEPGHGTLIQIELPVRQSDAHVAASVAEAS